LRKMDKGLKVLPCNGLDKEAGVLSRELALFLREKGFSLICPVLFQRSPSRYLRDLGASELLIVDGCKTGCASKLAKEQGLKIARRAVVTELLKERGLKPGKQPVASEENIRSLLSWVEAIVGYEGTRDATPIQLFAEKVTYQEFMVGKFIFKVPVSGYYFNENDCWARVEGNRALLGVSDYVQQSASDMVYFEPPPIGKEVAIFEEAGSLESTKTALDIISPVSGIVVAVNQELVEAPELINQDPYERGWAVEVELTDFESDRELLMDCTEYYSYLKDKVEREFQEKYGMR
jgi:glycine cleavage system H protein